jgi:tripartite-type tricarboxylate transporter receptor subunit TctC
VGGDDFFSTIMIEKAAGLQFQKIPFQGDGPSWSAALAGKIDASFNNLGITFPQIKAGNLRVLAVFAAERLQDLPDVPTLRELGIDVVPGSSRGYSAPKGMPEAARAEFIEAMKRVFKNPDFQRDAAARAMTLDFKGGADYVSYLKRQEAEFEQIWKEVSATEQPLAAK